MESCQVGTTEMERLGKQTCNMAYMQCKDFLLLAVIMKSGDYTELNYSDATFTYTLMCCSWPANECSCVC